MSKSQKRCPPKQNTQKEWKKEYPQLVFRPDSMYCKLCFDHNEKLLGCKNYNATFVNGSTNFRKSAVSEHFSSDMHREAMELAEKEKSKQVGEKYVKKLTPPGPTKIGESFKRSGKMTSQQKEYFERLFHVAYFIAKKGRPYTDYVEIIELEKLHKVKFFESSSYENETACRNFINYISDSLFDETVKSKLFKSSYIV